MNGTIVMYQHMEIMWSMGDICLFVYQGQMFCIYGTAEFMYKGFEMRPWYGEKQADITMCTGIPCGMLYLSPNIHC